MSHIMSLNQARDTCDASGNCESYEALVKIESDKVDLAADEHIHDTVIIGAALLVFGLVIVLIPYVGALKKVAIFILSRILTIALIPAGLAVGVLSGVIIRFSACFKSLCSPLEESTVYVLPLLSLVVTIPLTLWLWKRRYALAQKIAAARKLWWVTIGLTVITLTALLLFAQIQSVHDRTDFKQQQLMHPESL